LASLLVRLPPLGHPRRLHCPFLLLAPTSGLLSVCVRIAAQLRASFQASSACLVSSGFRRPPIIIQVCLLNSLSSSRSTQKVCPHFSSHITAHFRGLVDSVRFNTSPFILDSMGWASCYIHLSPTSPLINLRYLAMVSFRDERTVLTFRPSCGVYVS